MTLAFFVIGRTRLGNGIGDQFSCAVQFAAGGRVLDQADLFRVPVGGVEGQWILNDGTVHGDADVHHGLTVHAHGVEGACFHGDRFDLNYGAGIGELVLCGDLFAVDAFGAFQGDGLSPTVAGVEKRGQGYPAGCRGLKIHFDIFGLTLAEPPLLVGSSTVRLPLSQVHWPWRVTPVPKTS